ncbi:MAG: hypothetical protein Q4C70_14675 [Planctomycetia bacterium]|nr:hypothetical protein [Planctomycetia bacterium]
MIPPTVALQKIDTSFFCLPLVMVLAIAVRIYLQQACYMLNIPLVCFVGLCVTARFSLWPERELLGVSRSSGNTVFWFSVPVALMYVMWCVEPFLWWATSQSGFFFASFVSLSVLWLMPFLLFVTKVAKCIDSGPVTGAVWGIIVASFIFPFTIIEVEKIVAFHLLLLFLLSLLLMFLFLGLDLRKRVAEGFPKVATTPEMLEMLETPEILETTNMSMSHGVLRWVRWGITLVLLVLMTLLTVAMLAWWCLGDSVGPAERDVNKILLPRMIYGILGIYMLAQLCFVLGSYSAKTLVLNVGALAVLVASVVFWQPFLFPVSALLTLVPLYHLACHMGNETQETWQFVFGILAVLLIMPLFMAYYKFTIPLMFVLGIVLLFVLFRVLEALRWKLCVKS